MTDIFLAFSAGSSAMMTLERLGPTPPINLLVSFYYLDAWEQRFAGKQTYCRTMLDSGAFSAWKSGKKIDINALIAETKKARWDESVGLDVIGDPAASLKNILSMKEQGSPAYPVFHIGEPWEILTEYCRQFPKVGLSCRFGEPLSKSYGWLEQCFARQWPHQFHSFGWVAERMLKAYPFVSADTASWNNAPSCFGRWKAFGEMSVRGGQTDLRAEIDVYLRLQGELKSQWGQEQSRWTQSTPLPKETSSTSEQSATSPSPSLTLFPGMESQ